jgi:hypothetical protein
MAVKLNVPAVRVSVSDREFELLLRRASECAKAGSLRLVKQPGPAPRAARRSPRSAA